MKKLFITIVILVTILVGVAFAATTIQLRGDTAANWTSYNPTLHAREVGIETDTLKLKIGNGSSAWNSLSYVTSDYPKFELYLATTGAITSGATVTVKFTTVNLDSAASYSVGTGVYTVPISGFYHFDVWINTTATTITDYTVYLYKNSTAMEFPHRAPTETVTDISFPIPLGLQLAAGDKIYIKVTPYGTGTIQASPCRFSGFYVP